VAAGTKPHVVEGISPDAVLEGLAESGSVLIRGAENTVEDFERLSAQVMTPMVHQATGTDERDIVNADGTTSTVNKGKDAIPFHREGSYAPGGPDLLVLYCVTPAASGGATTLCDGALLLESLSPSTRTFVDGARLRWSWDAPPERWQPTLRTESKEEAEVAIEYGAAHLPKGEQLTASFVGDVLRGAYVTSCVIESKLGGHGTFANSLLIYHLRAGSEYFARDLFSVSLEDGSPFPADVLAEIGQVADEITYEVDWRHGDILAIENTRMMHGRRAFTDPARRVLISMGHLRPGEAA
jgi:alpha-ketoglutarate-dependent taurine dioxygenase